MILGDGFDAGIYMNDMSVREPPDWINQGQKTYPNV